MAKNTVCHIEIGVADSKAASEFYKNLFDWKINSDMGDEYIMFQPEEGPGGAFSKTDMLKPGTGVCFYVEVDDIEAYLAKSVELGGKAVVPKTNIPNVGWFAHFSDPDGNLMGLFTGK